jgi:hypothetical protein
MLDTHNISYHKMEIKTKEDALAFARATMLVSKLKATSSTTSKVHLCDLSSCRKKY